MVLDQFILKTNHPDMPKTAGGVEGTLDRIGTILEKRGEFYSNARRLELLCGLIRLEAIGVANETHYSEVIAGFIAARDGLGLDWQDGRDILGSSSLDDLIDNAIALGAVAPSTDRNNARRRSYTEQRAAADDALRAAKGLPTARTGVYRRPDGGASYYPIAKGQTVATTPLAQDFWRPEYNDGRQADEIGAGSGKDATWVCDAHEADGHLHIWSRRIIDMCTSRTACPYCTGRRVCPSTSLARLFPDLAGEWAPTNPLTPDKVPAGSANMADWKCAQPKHPVFPQRISARTKQQARCPRCAIEERVAITKAKTAARSAAARKMAAGTRAVTRPEVLAPHEATVVGHDEAVVSVTRAATALHRSTETIINWTDSGRLRVRLDTRGKASVRRVPVSEIERVGVATPRHPGV